MTERKLLPNRRHSWSQKAKVGGQTVHLGVGLYDDGSIGEIFIDANKKGTLVRAMLDTIAIFISIGLQHGISLHLFLDVIRGLDFPPNGTVHGSTEVTEAKSILDYLAKELEKAFPKDRTA